MNQKLPCANGYRIKLEHFQIEMTENNHGEENTGITLSAMDGGEGRGEVASIAVSVFAIWPAHS